MIAVNWYRPYRDLDEARATARQDYGDGLYMCIGKRPYQRKVSMQYIRIGSNVHTRIKEGHHNNEGALDPVWRAPFRVARTIANAQPRAALQAIIKTGSRR